MYNVKVCTNCFMISWEEEHEDKNRTKLKIQREPRAVLLVFLILAANILRAKKIISTPLRIENPGRKSSKVKTTFGKTQKRKWKIKVRMPEKSPIVPPITDIWVSTVFFTSLKMTPIHRDTNIYFFTPICIV